MHFFFLFFFSSFFVLRRSIEKCKVSNYVCASFILSLTCFAYKTSWKLSFFVFLCRSIPVLPACLSVCPTFLPCKQARDCIYRVVPFSSPLSLAEIIFFQFHIFYSFSFFLLVFPFFLSFFFQLAMIRTYKCLHRVILFLLCLHRSTENCKHSARLSVRLSFLPSLALMPKEARKRTDALCHVSFRKSIKGELINMASSCRLSARLSFYAH